MLRISLLSYRIRRSSPWAMLCGGIGFALWIYTVTHANYLNMGPLGLVSLLGKPYFIGLGFVAIGFALELLRTPLHPSRVVVFIAILIVFMFGTACAIEPTAGLPTTWVHSGMVQYIYDHGQVLDNYRAEFSWPGDFSLSALIVAFTGERTATDLLRWFPLAIELLYLAPMLVIARFSGAGRRAGYLGVALFFTSDWIYQDYFSPQALNYLFFLVVVGAVLACWRPQHPFQISGTHRGLGARIRESRAALTMRRFAGRDAVGGWRSGTTLVILFMLGIITFASAISHQLTPYALILALAGCLLARRLGRPELIFVLVLFSIGWLSLGASNYWTGHLSDIFGGVGQLSNTLGSNVTSHVSGNTTHLLIVGARILLTVAIYFLAGVGFLRRAPDSRVLEVLAGAPVLLLGAQSYGGEGALRVVLFALPFVCLLAASAILPNRQGAIRPLFPRLKLYKYGRPVLIVVVTLAVAGAAVATSVVRGGNDTYESFSTGELAAVNFAYAQVHAGQTIGVIGAALPIGQEGLGSINISDGANVAKPSPKATAKQLLKEHAKVIILSESEEAWGEQVEGFPAGWEAGVLRSLLRGGYHVAAKWQTATVLQVSKKA